MYFLNINELQGFSCLNIYIAFQVATPWNLYTRILPVDMRAWKYIILFLAKAKDTIILRQQLFKQFWKIEKITPITSWYLSR